MRFLLLVLRGQIKTDRQVRRIDRVVIVTLLLELRIRRIRRILSILRTRQDWLGWQSVAVMLCSRAECQI